MNAPTHIRFTDDENAAIEAYAEAYGLKKASAVRALLQIGLEASHAPDASDGRKLRRSIDELREQQDHALVRIELRLTAIERALKQRSRRPL